jgi:C-terminal processing protease CtpA/Prc
MCSSRTNLNNEIESEMKKTNAQIFIPLALLLLIVFSPALLAAEPQPRFAAAQLVNDEGGPLVLRGQLSYTDPFFTVGVAAPMVILEDQAGFIDRNEAFLFPKESQTLGQITSDFSQSPFSYTLALPIEPQGTLRDVDNDGNDDLGVMVFAVAYWTNIFGDPFLEERDLFGGGWSTAYASTRTSADADTRREIIGGKFLVYAPDDQQGFPSDFGPDGLLFTADDPIVGLPAGYTLVDLDTSPFTFDRSSRPVIDLLEPDGAALKDFSPLGYAAAFDAMVDLMRKEYAFTDAKGLDWDELSTTFRPRFADAEAGRDVREYLRALRDFTFAIPDGHVSGPFVAQDFQAATAGGVGMAIRELDDGRVIANYLTPGGPAERAGIQLRAEILAVNGLPVGEAIDATFAWSGPFSTAHYKRLQQLRYVLRAAVGERFDVRYRNPGVAGEETATLVTTSERESFTVSSFDTGRTGVELPVEFKLLDNGYGYVRIYSFADNDLLTVQLWERMIQVLNGRNVPGLVIDMRQNSGGKGFLADQMAAYFFNEPLRLGNTGYYNEKLDDFFFDPRTEDRFYLPSADLRYHGKVAVLIGPNCKSACEFFAYDMSIQERAAIVGQYPTAGLGGSVAEFKMPGGQFIRYTIGRAVDMNGEIHIEGKGVTPTVKVPVDETTLFGAGDPVLEAALVHLRN